MTAIGDRDLWAVLRAAADVSIRARLALAALLAILAAALSGFAPLALKQLIDRLSAEPAEASAFAFLALYLAAMGAGRLAAQAQTYVFATGDQRLQARLSAAAFDHLLRLPMRFHLDRQAGGLIQIHAQALQGVRTVLMMTGFTLLPALVQMFVILAVVAGLFDGWLWLAVAVAMAAYTIVFTWGVRRVAEPTRAALATHVEASGLFADGLANVEAVKSFVAEDRLGARYTALGASAEQSWRLFHARRLETGFAVALVFVLSMGWVLSLGVSGLVSRQISIGDFVLLNAYMLQIVGPLESAGFAVRELAQGGSYLAGWKEVLRNPPEDGARPPLDQAAKAPQRGRLAPAIRFKDVSFAYEHGRDILSGVDFDVRAGGVVAVVGPSGAGKSSLLRLLQRHDLPSSGKILFDDISIEDLDIRDLRGRMSVVTQDVVLFNDTLRYNLLFARPDADTRALQHAIAVARLDKLVSRLPRGLESPVGERGLKLSGGEKQRVAIARAVLRNAPVLVLDEPTSALDADTETAISADLIVAARGRTTLIVTHRLALAVHADVILVLENGRIVERGRHDRLIGAGGSYSRLWRSQTGGAGAAPAVAEAQACAPDLCADKRAAAADGD